MKLNRNNYEEYFILYLDNELDSESRLEVEAFAQQNPDLKAELEMLLQSKLVPDAAISFSDKDSLMRFHNSTISLANYEEWLIAYIDNELSPEDRKDAENFIAGNPSIQRELNLLQRTKLQPEAIVFPYKESLYRREENPDSYRDRVIPVRWLRIAAAAVLLLAVSTTTVVLINNKGNGVVEGTTAAQNNEEKLKVVDTINQSGKESLVKEQVPVVDNKRKDNSNEIKKPALAIVKQNGIKPEDLKERIVPVKNDNIAQSPIDNQKTDGNVSAGNATASANVIEPSLTDPKEKSTSADVTRTTPGSSINETESVKPNENPDVQFASNNKKGGVRGFLRKVTRTFEKRTNIKATDDDDRLLIAGLALKL